jgi:hypothetical protein
MYKIHFFYHAPQSNGKIDGLLTATGYTNSDSEAEKFRATGTWFLDGNGMPKTMNWVVQSFTAQDLFDVFSVKAPGAQK